MYDDEGPTESPVNPDDVAVAPLPEGHIQVTIQGWSARSVQERIDDCVAASIKDQINKAVANAARDVVERIAETIVAERIRAEVERICGDGWQRTDEYGRPTGQKKTLADVVLDYFNKRNDYGDRRSMLEETIKKVAEAALGPKGVLGAEIEAARVKLREMLDTSVMASWTAAMKQSLGIKG